VENNPNVPNHQPEMINGIFHCRDITWQMAELSES
jgi:hypothetical protein